MPLLCSFLQHCGQQTLFEEKRPFGGGLKGYNGRKKVKGRKRHILVDTQGFLVQAAVIGADFGDREWLKNRALSRQIARPPSWLIAYDVLQKYISKL